MHSAAFSAALGHRTVQVPKIITCVRFNSDEPHGSLATLYHALHGFEASRQTSHITNSRGASFMKHTIDAHGQ